MNTQQRLVSTMPLSKELLGESFVDEEELAAKILHGVQEREGADASDTRLKTRKRRRGKEEGPTVKRLKEGPFDSLPTPWKTCYYDKGLLRIKRKERLVREEKYKISFDTSLQSFDGIKHRMLSNGWNLEYASISNSNDLLVKGCIEVPSEFGHSFPDILKELKEIIADEREIDS
ncbi:hypothetical protein B0T10DRAFT_593180 [Thelonectria olida]|uniref:Uncharacterized protein n=1 Tax=Thelonectria olida TaxID=1576542 RepID=A0A9P8VNM0_9HYPO|nr:hypothetical protein B0T10DRAFT_593180 [Thelonectria olida]